jgi:hypothetical protein
VFIEGKGVKRKFVQIRRANHWGDSTCYAVAAACSKGLRLTGQPSQVDVVPLKKIRRIKQVHKMAD